MKIILVTGGTGLVGSAFTDSTQHKFVLLSRKDVDLQDRNATIAYFENLKPNYVIHLAANVGGLFKNMNYKVEMFSDNIKINLNVLEASYLSNVEKVVSCLSTCIFPDKTSYPITEEMLHDGPPHWSNDAYAYSKRMLEVLSKSYQTQYQKDFVRVIPCNVYGPNDNFSLDNGHVIPSLIHQAYLAKRDQTNFVIKGSGTPLRQFIYSKDLARLLTWTLFEYKGKDPIILASEEEFSIREIGYLIAEMFEIPEERIVFDTTFSDGQYKKTASIEKLKSLFPGFQETNIKTGLNETIEFFCNNYPNIRK
jgi:GDP-L-fucose synthase